MICIVVPVFWNRTSSLALTSFTSPTQNWSTSFSFFLYRAFLPKQWNLIYASKLILLRICRYGYVDVTCCNTSLILHGIFSTIEKDTTKSLGLRTIRVPESTSRLQSNREETNANGGTKWWQISKDLKKIIQNRCSSESKNSFGESHCLMCRFEWENKKFVILGV